ncbi:BrxA family protein [Deinococcus yavapaiensis]|uniref:Putative inner membrane protein DUF1819 n=1 Tax=Deinococcus yavapaiensis KR-236 TaxID=694435 RepID=A0A318S4V6_9DEIO|nr:BrxA family protein [Deinococcus yavapaiensis]PYE52020.1 putative inner membrane protein DUF1819 [Deinococcus yavapaiensis KR-236]
MAALNELYQAGTNLGFRLAETTEVARLLLAGLGEDDVLREAVERDLFGVRSPASRRTLARALLTRLQGVPRDVLELLVDGDSTSRRLANFALVLREHRLLREFIADVALERAPSAQPTLTRGDLGAFLARKQVQEPTVGAWSDATLKRVRTRLVELLLAAGLLEIEDRRTYRLLTSRVPKPLQAALRGANLSPLLPLLLDPHA